MIKKKELEILGLTISHSTPDAYTLLLTEKESGTRLPIIIGTNEAQAIAVAIDNLQPPRPFIHDSFFNVMLHFGIELKETYIYKVIKGVFYAKMICEQNGKQQYFDIRSSDAIAMALRFNVPILTNTEVLDFAGINPLVDLKKQNNTKEMTTKEIQNAINEAVKKEDYETASLLNDLLIQRQNDKKSDQI